MQRILLILVPAILFFSFRKNPKPGNQQSVNCQEILDSADVLAKTVEFALHWEPNQLDHRRNLEVFKWFERRSFSELKCLLESANKLHKVYGFIYAARDYPDSLNGRYDDLLEDTTSVQYQTPDKLIDTKMTVGAILKDMYEHIKDDQQNMNKRPKVEEKVSTFIKTYSLYPDTYKSQSFPFFAIVGDDKGLGEFKVRHFYEIKDKRGKMVRITSEFVLDPALNINVIEQDSTSYLSSYPPMLSEWFNKYGRQLNRNDSVSLRLK